MILLAEPQYGVDHQRRRDELLPLAIGTLCPRCGDPMLETDELDLGHSTDHAIDPYAIGDRIEHAHCNRSAGAILRNTLERFKPSRKW